MIELNDGQLVVSLQKHSLMLAALDKNAKDRYIEDLRIAIEHLTLEAWWRHIVFKKFPAHGKKIEPYKKFLLENGFTLVEAAFLSGKIDDRD